jgi:hypothetical protein
MIYEKVVADFAKRTQKNLRALEELQEKEGKYSK